jgi:hypothetical protein
MAAGSTYTPIATTTLGSAAASYTFSSISGSYTDLVLIMQAKSTGGYASFKITVNSDTGTNYSQTVVSGTGSAASSSRLSSNPNFDLCRASGLSSDGFGAYIVNFMNYSNTTTYKTFLDRTNVVAGTGGDAVEAMVGLWRSTSAITSITATPGSGNLAVGTTLTLYGIAAA